VIAAIRLGSSPADIQRAADILNNGGLAAFPTETVYGLGADAFNARALARVFEAKGRPRFDPLIIHIASMDTLERIADLDTLSPSRRLLLEKLTLAFWPGPLTLILPKRHEVPGLATAGLPTVAVRFPAHPAAQKLIALSSGAVAAPSANPFGRLSPTRAEHVFEGLGNKIDCIIDGGPCSVGVESTVLSLTGEEPPRILRPGGVSREDLERIIGPAGSGVKTCYHDASPADAGNIPLSPGMLKSHYAPKTPLILHSPEEMSALPFLPDEGYLFFSEKNRDAWLKRNAEKIPMEDLKRIHAKSPEGDLKRIHIKSSEGDLKRIHAKSPEGDLKRIHGKSPEGDLKRIHDKSPEGDLKCIHTKSPAVYGTAIDAGPVIFALSASGDAVEAAVQLFECLHLLDRAGFCRIHAEALPPEGLGAAVNDRLRRAAG
jgi:L-threonylcarbamoyladenylate synthase